MRTIIIDDEKNIREGLKILLEAHSEICIIAEAGTIEEGKEKVDRLKPDLLFLDIKLKNKTGFNLLEDLDFKDFKLVFITAYNEYALKAFKYNAFDYLLKPIAPQELEETLTRLQLSSHNFERQQKIAKENTQLNRLVIKTTEQIYVLDLDHIIRCESDQGYTTFFLKNNTKIISAKTLKEYNSLLPKEQFLRVHQSHLIHTKYIKKYHRKGMLELLNNDCIPVSIRKRKEISEQLRNLH